MQSRLLSSGDRQRCRMSPAAAGMGSVTIHLKCIQILRNGQFQPNDAPVNCLILRRAPSCANDPAVHKIAPCMWFDGNAEDAARFMRRPSPTAASMDNRSPSDYPDGKEGDVLTVEFTVLGMPFLGLNGGSQFSFDEQPRFKSTPTTKPKLTATGMRSSIMVIRKATAVGARTGSVFPGKSYRVRSWTQ